MPILQKRVQFHFAAAMADALLFSLSKTWHISIEDPERLIRSFAACNGPHIATFWHRYLLSMVSIFRGYPVAIPVSEHKDGEYIAHLIERYGMNSIRGSTTRGSLRLLRKLIDHLKAGGNCALTPDGPRGPNMSVQPGFALLSRKTGTPVSPIAVAIDRGWTLNSWDRLVIPKPFANIQIVIGRTVNIPPEGKIEQYCESLHSAMLELGDRAAANLTATV